MGGWIYMKVIIVKILDDISIGTARIKSISTSTWNAEMPWAPESLLCIRDNTYISKYILTNKCDERKTWKQFFFGAQLS